MDWTFWAGAAVIGVLIIGSQWLFSETRWARRIRRHDPDQADAIEIADAERREIKSWHH